MIGSGARDSRWADAMLPRQSPGRWAIIQPQASCAARHRPIAVATGANSGVNAGGCASRQQASAMPTGTTNAIGWPSSQRARPCHTAAALSGETPQPAHSILPIATATRASPVNFCAQALAGPPRCAGDLCKVGMGSLHPPPSSRRARPDPARWPRDRGFAVTCPNGGPWTLCRCRRTVHLAQTWFQRGREGADH